ncbi:MAG: hypothetical protein NAG76_14395 [Candidatus Pristimantibacillus lignocellulolyticus]|uniref:Antigen I/II N-terminal domain-containing protein n=1 Tax=Candidatus Pristimantibacillus lignocellulolyticus TaxID=2994561 RepID=A0A9J6ZA01_9BACL|nr:MAG: hypothetical protein NAG76_14395 [Candidatus Pristimantibacillus lignocellulolyticus]
MSKFNKVTIAIFTSILLLAGCSSSDGNSNTANQYNKPAAENTTSPSPENNASTDAEGNSSIEVDKNLLTVDITLPASMFKDQNMDEVIAAAKSEGVKDAKIHDDGSVTYTYPKSVHSAMMKEMKEEVILTLEEMKTSEDFTSIKDVKYNDDLNKFTLIVDKAAYEGGFDGFASLGIGIQSMYYQNFNGVASDKVKVTIDIKDITTDEIFDTIIYPDDLGN